MPSRIHSTRSGLTLVEVLVVVAAGVVALLASLPVLAAISCDARRARSQHNLATLAQSHAAYAADWDDRQFTLVVDNLGAFSGSCPAYTAAFGCHPAVLLGEDCNGINWQYGMGCPDGSCSNIVAAKPFQFAPSSTFGAFRLCNAAEFNSYVSGRFYDQTFYAPADQGPYEQAAPAFSQDCGYVDLGGQQPILSSYILSPAAMYNPEVLSYNSATGQLWRSPNSFATGYTSPTNAQAVFPELKTRMIEHHWMYNAPAPCNPASAGCAPYLFNQGIESRPEALFFDGSVRALGPYEASLAESRTQPAGFKLWSRNTPLGNNGYFLAQSYDFFGLSSYHILTRDGIAGRDLLSTGK